jgi:predicted RNase H-like HicB family nuclease
MDLIVKVIYNDDEGYYIATSSELDIYGVGETLSEALENYAYWLDDYIQELINENPELLEPHFLEQRNTLLSMIRQ